MSKEDLVFAACLAASLYACAWIVYHVDSPLGDLIRLHSDHLHHVRATWAFWNMGWDVYRLPLRTTASGPPFPQIHVIPWPEFPVAYPPGMFAIFALPTWLGITHPSMPAETFAKWTVFWIVLLSHVGLVGVWRALSLLPGGRAPLMLGIWLLTWRMCLHGFYDAIWVGAAGMSIAALARNRPGRSLVWFAVAMLISYRAASVAPVAAWAAWRFVWSDVKPWKKVALFAGVGAVGLLVIWTFWLFTKGSPPPDSAVYQAAASHLAEDPIASKMVWYAGAVTAIIALLSRDLLVAICVLWATELTMRHGGHSWHGTILLGAGLLVGATNRRVPVAFLRNVVALWIFALWQLVFENPLYAVVHDVLVLAKFK